MSAKLNSFSCPFCHYRLNAATGVGIGAGQKPRNGDFSVCIRCGEPSIFVKEGRRISQRKPTLEEYDEMMAVPEVVKAIDIIKIVSIMFPPEREKETE